MLHGGGGDRRRQDEKYESFGDYREDTTRIQAKDARVLQRDSHYAERSGAPLSLPDNFQAPNSIRRLIGELCYICWVPLLFSTTVRSMHVQSGSLK